MQDVCPHEGYERCCCTVRRNTARNELMLRMVGRILVLFRTVLLMCSYSTHIPFFCCFVFCCSCDLPGAGAEQDAINASIEIQLFHMKRGGKTFDPDKCFRAILSGDGDDYNEEVCFTVSFVRARFYLYFWCVECSSGDGEGRTFFMLESSFKNRPFIFCFKQA